MEWTTEERERILEALEETPDLLKDKNIHGIYRMKKGVPPENPASNNYSDFVLYDDAFSEKFILTHVLDHELAHRFFENLPEAERDHFRKAAQWKENPLRRGTFLPGRPEKSFVRSNDTLSPTEDFADAITAFVHEPSRLNNVAPAVYDWMKGHVGPRLRGSK